MIRKTLFFIFIFTMIMPEHLVAAPFPKCTQAYEKMVWYNPNSAELKYCFNGKWTDIDITGEQGDNGEDGQQGAKGPTGDRGNGIASVTINESGDFVFVYGEGSSCTTTVGP